MDLFRLKKEHCDGDDDNYYVDRCYVDRNSIDPDAHFGHKTPQNGF